jgi:hypothetical protein
MKRKENTPMKSTNEEGEGTTIVVVCSGTVVPNTIIKNEES